MRIRSIVTQNLLKPFLYSLFLPGTICSLTFGMVMVVAVTASTDSERSHYSTMPDMQSIGPRTEKVDFSAYKRVLHVSGKKGSADGFGSSDRPFADINQALKVAAGASESSRCAILVAEGCYPVINLQMVAYVDFFGGYDAQEWNERDVLSNPTILDAQQAGPVVLGADPSRLDGFHITGGKNDGMGGGIVCHSVSPELSNNSIYGNKTIYSARIEPETLHLIGHEGAGIAVWGSANPTIRRNLIYNNTTDVGDAGAISIRDHSNPVIQGNALIANQTGLTDTTMYDGKVGSRSSNGGAISVSTFSKPDIRGNILALNYVHNTSDGGGIYVEFGSTPLIRNNWLVGNTTSDDGGAIYCRGLEDMSAPIGPACIEGNIFAGNRIFHEGRQKKGFTEAIFLSKRGRATILNNLFLGQLSGIGVGNSTMIAEGNIIVEHSGTGIYMDLREELAGVEQSTIRGNIIWNNNRQIELNRLFSAPPKVEYNQIQGGYEGEGNTQQKPFFLDNRLSFRILRSYFNEPECNTVLEVEPSIDGASLAGRLACFGEKWSVIRSNSPQQIMVWGDLREHGESLTIPATYILNQGDH